ncbi:MAG: hypothetical protein K0R87_1060 [Pseudonocardia sp.]|jgi:hypothetical protein|nr:hypothetical protein [Pseudonocardia sp.]
MDSAHYRRQLLQKQEQQAAAQKKVGDARKKEADKRSAAAKATASANATKSDTTRRSKLRHAERDVKAANSAGQDAAREQAKVASLGKDIATLQARAARAEQGEAQAASRKQRSDAAAAERRHREVVRRLSRTEADVTALRETRPPKAERLRILMLAASSDGDLRVGREQAQIRAAVESATHRDLVEFDVRTSATTADLLDGLTKFRPHVIHFSGHGSDELVVFEDDVDSGHCGVVVKAGAFASALGSISDPPLLVMLNSCRSASQIDNLVEQVVPFAIGMSDSIHDRDAIRFAARFYASIANGTTLQEAHDLGRAALALDGLPGADLPQLAHAPDADPRATTLVVPPASAQDAVS